MDREWLYDDEFFVLNAWMLYRFITRGELPHNAADAVGRRGLISPLLYQVTAMYYIIGRIKL